MPSGLSDAAEVERRLGRVQDADRLADAIAEPLAISAPMAFALARGNCRPSEPPADCRDYHAVWQYLRLTGVTRSVRGDGPLFAAVAARRAEAGRLRRVLICATADYSMLAYLGHAARGAGAQTRFDVMDRCRTALQLNAWYAARNGLDVRSIAADVFAFAPDEPYDLICTHSFLSWLEYAQRPRLMARWRDWLAPGGEACFSTRIDSEARPPDARWHAQRVESRTAEFFLRCDEMQIELPADRETFRALIRRFGDRSLYRRRDMLLPAIQEWLEAAGLALELAVPVASAVANARDKASSTIGEAGRPRIWFLARRT